MSDNVASLFGAAPIGAQKVVPEVVEQLEILLEMARSGKLHGILYATVEVDGAVGSGWRSDAEHFRNVAAVNDLFFRINASGR